MRIVSFLKTTTFRLALLYAGLFSVSFVILFFAINWTAEISASRKRQAEIWSDIEALRVVYEQKGLGALSQAILERTAPNRVGDAIYILATRDYEVLAGNSRNWPVNPEVDDGLLVFSIDRSELGDTAPHRAEAMQVTVMPGEYRLLVGRDTRVQERFQQGIRNTFIASLAGLIVFAIVVGLVMSRAILGRIDAINQAAERIMHGGVKHRMPVRGRHDEFDRLSENLNRMLDEIERLLGSIRAVTNNIAHDLRSPLNRLRNRLETALEERDSEGRRDTIERAIAEADDLLATFNALLSIADAEAGTSRGNLLPVDLVALGQDVAELYEPLVEEQGLVLEKSLAGPATVSGNRQLLFQAIGNLIDNAAKYGAAGGRVSLQVLNNGAGPEVIVADHGPGIPALDRARVLERFVRLDGSRSTPGNGLGLSLVAAIARLHDAALNLDDNAPGLKVTLRFRRATV